MTKTQLLQELDEAEHPDAHDIAESLGMSYPAAAMALLRLVRQGLATRYRDPDCGLYWYELKEKGAARLDYLENAEDSYQWEQKNDA